MFQVCLWKMILKYTGFTEMPTLRSSKRMSNNSLKPYWACSQETQQVEKVDKLPIKLVREWQKKSNRECLTLLKSKEWTIQTHWIFSECRKSKDSINSFKLWKKVYLICKKPSKVLSLWVLHLKTCSFHSLIKKCPKFGKMLLIHHWNLLDHGSTTLSKESFSSSNGLRTVQWTLIGYQPCSSLKDLWQQLCNPTPEERTLLLILWCSELKSDLISKTKLPNNPLMEWMFMVFSLKGANATKTQDSCRSQIQTFSLLKCRSYGKFFI